MPTGLPGSKDTFTRPVPGDPFLSSNGKSQTQMDDDVKDAVEYLEGIAGVGPPFVNAMNFPVTPEVLLNNAESITTSGPQAGLWKANNVATGFALTASGTASQGTHSITARLCTGSTNNPLSTSAMYFNFTTPIPVAGHAAIVIDARFHIVNAGSSTGVQPGTVTAFLISESADMVGGAGSSRLSWPVAANYTPDVWIPIKIFTKGLTQIGSIGLVSNGWLGTATFQEFFLDNVRWAAQTEFDTALVQNPNSTVVIPQNYVPAIPQDLPVQLGANQGVLDLRPSGRYLSRAGGVRHVREFGLTDETGGTDYTTELGQAISSLNEGDTLQFSPGGIYRIDGVVQFDKSQRTFEGQGCAFVRPTPVNDNFFTVHSVADLTFRNIRVIGSNPETTPGSSLVDEVGAPLHAGATVKLDTQYESVILDPAESHPHSRNEHGKIVVEAVLADTAAVPNDFVMQIYDTDAPPPPTVIMTPGFGGSVPSGTWYYRYSFVDSDGHETGMSQPGKLVASRYHTADVTIASGPQGGVDGAKYVARRIYRTDAVNQPSPFNDSFYNFLAEVNDNTTTMYRDNRGGPGTVDEPAGQPQLTQGAAGNVGAGKNYYFVSTVSTGFGETKIVGPNSITLTANSHVILGTVGNPLPGTGVSGIAARRIYRSTAGGLASSRQMYLVAEIPNNTAVSYDDNIADANLIRTDHPADAPPSTLAKHTNLPSASGTLSSTPTKKTITWNPFNGGLDMNLGVRIIKQTATPNVITVTSVKTYGRVKYDASIEGSHGFALIGNAQNITIEDCLIEGVPGDAVTVTGISCRDTMIRRVTSRACHRQGFSVTYGEGTTFESCNIFETGRSGIDIEPVKEEIETQTTINNCLFRNVTNIAIACAGNWAHRLTVTNNRMIGGTHMGTIGFMNAGTTYGKFIDNVAPNFSSTIEGFDLLVDGLDCSAFSISTGREGAWYADKDLTSTVATVRNVKVHSPALDGSAFSIGQPNASVQNVVTEKANRSFTGKLGGPFKIRSDTNAAILDPGPWAMQFPDTYKGIVAGDLWYPRGLDMVQDGLLNVRGISSTGVRANNMFRRVAIPAGATGATINFPAKTYPNFSSFTLSSAADGGNMTAGTYFYRVASRPVVGGPVLPLAEKSIAISAPNSVEINVTGFSQGTVYIEGATIYRGTASGIYTVRYDVVPNLDNHFLSSDTNGMHTFADLGTTLSPTAFDVNGGTGYPTIAQTAGLWTTAAGPNALRNETGDEADTNYTMGFTASWPTTVALSAVRTNGVDVVFGAACPAGGGTLDCVPGR